MEVTFGTFKMSFASVAFFCGFFLSGMAIAETVAVIGTGRMGGAIGPRFAETGHTVIYGSRDPAAEKVRDLIARSGSDATAKTQEEAIAAADIIVLALPWHATEALVKSTSDDLAGKIIMDITNASLRALRPDNESAVDSSAGVLIQSWAPESKVVKAFNTVGFHVVADPSLGNGPVTVPLVGNDDAAKQRVAEIVQAMGFETIILGAIEQAHVLEGMASLYFVPYGSGRFDEAFEYHFRKGTAPPGVSSSRVRGAN